MSNKTAITAQQISIVKETWAKVVPISDVASRLFYDRLFEISPHLAPMFHGVDLASQRQKLVKAINMVVMSLERIDTLIPTIHDLGHRHIAYGVEEAHYAQVGSALLWTLKTGLGDDWSDEAETAWTNAYQLLAGVMIEGAREATKYAA
jgi:hemoglobin-like flavoprotein